MRNYKAIGILFFISILWVGCTKVKVNFKLNEIDIKPTNELPTDPGDSTHVLLVGSGDTIYVKDNTEGKVRSRSWDLDGDGEIDVKNRSFFPIAFEESGFNKITLCVNGDEECISKWIFVRSKIERKVIPFVQFLEPNESPFRTKRSSVKLKVKTENIASKSDLILSVGADPVRDFSFNEETGILNANVKLKEGLNLVEVGVNTEDGIVRKSMDINYVKSNNRPPAPKPPKPKPEEPIRPPSTPALVGPPSSGFDESCAPYSSKSSFKISLAPVKDIEIRSFYVYSSNCGSLKVTLNGPEGPQEFTASLNKGKSQITFNILEPILESGKKYTLTCKPMASSLGCNSNVIPQLRVIDNCPDTGNTSPELVIDQKKTPFIYDLKFLF